MLELYSVFSQQIVLHFMCTMFKHYDLLYLFIRLVDRSYFVCHGVLFIYLWNIGCKVSSAWIQPRSNLIEVA